MPDDLYHRDFLAWTREQAAALRAAAASGTNLPLDWPNLIEEIETLGRGERRELTGRLGTIAEHLLKLIHSPAVDPRRGWEETIARSRREAEAVLEDSPSLVPEIPDLVQRAVRRVAVDVARDLALRGEATREAVLATRLTPEQVLGHWFAEPPPRP